MNIPILIKATGGQLNLFKYIVNLFANALTFFHSGGFGWHWSISWGWAIIIFTVVIKFLLFPTSIKQFQVMNKMKELQPKLKAIQDKYKEQPEEFQRRTMELYKKEKVNPFGGCLPMLIQLPILWAVFSMLQDPFFIRHSIGSSATFLGLILTQKHYLWLAIISGATTFFQTKVSTPTTGNDPNQKVFLYIMPVMFGFFTFQVNAGVGLYWVVSNAVGIAQQYLINEFFIVKEHIHKVGENILGDGEEISKEDDTISKENEPKQKDQQSVPKDTKPSLKGQEALKTNKQLQEKGTISNQNSPKNSTNSKTKKK